MTTAADLARLVAGLARLAEQLAVQDANPAPPKPQPTPGVLLTVEEAAQRLRVGRTTAYGLVASGELDSVRIGRLRRVHIAAVEKYAAGLAGETTDNVAA